MRPISQIRTLVYYDGVQVFEGRDSIGGHHVGVLIDDSGAADRYLVTGVDPESLRQFRAGAIDLRTLFLEAGAGEWRLADVGDGFRAPVTPMRPEDPGACRALLPDEGFILHYGTGNGEAIQLESDVAEAYGNRGGAKASLGRLLDDLSKHVDWWLNARTVFLSVISVLAVFGGYVVIFNRFHEIEPDEKRSTAKKMVEKMVEEENTLVKTNRDRGRVGENKRTELDEAVSAAVIVQNDGKSDANVAMEAYDNAIRATLDYSAAYNNRGVAEADPYRIADYDKEILIGADNAEYYFNRGVAKFYLDIYGIRTHNQKMTVAAMQMEPK